MDEGTEAFAASFFPTCAWVLRRLQQKHVGDIADRVLNIYLWGSRHDWDCIVVTRYNTPHDTALIAADKNKLLRKQHHEEAEEEEQEPVVTDGLTTRASEKRPSSLFKKKNISEIDSSLFPIYQDDYINATLIPIEEWIMLLREHRHMALEAVYAPAKFKLLEKHPITVALDPDILRRTVLWESTRTFVASGNKLLMPGGFTEYNYHRARKEIVHSLRYLIFAIQLVRTGRIEDYSAANRYLADILEEKQESEEKEKEKETEETTGVVVDKKADEGTKAGKRRRGAKRGSEGNEEDAKRWDAVVGRFKPTFEQLRQELKDLRDYAHLYSRRDTEKMLHTSLKDRRRDDPKPSAHVYKTASAQGENEEGPLATVRFLRQSSEGSVDEALATLEKDHHVIACRHSRHPNLLLLTADPYSIPSWDDASEISSECKGLIVDIQRGFAVVAYPFSRARDLPPVVDDFLPTRVSKDSEDLESRWREEEGRKSLHVTECLDGLTAVLYFYAGEWHLSSNYEPDKPSTNMTWKEEDCSIPFDRLFWDAWRDSGYKLPQDEEHCYTFELLSHKHRHLVRPPHDARDSLILTAVRHLPTLQEQDPREWAETCGWESVPYFDSFRSLEEVRASARSINPFVCKGYVVVDTSNPARWRRWVIKSPQYVAVQHGTDLTTVGPLNLRADMDERHMVELLRYNKASEFLEYHPQWRTFAGDLISQHNEMCDRLQEIWDQLMGTPDQRSFAAVSKKHGGAGHDFIFFKMRKEGVHVYSSVRQYLALAEDSIFTKLLFFWSKRPTHP